MCRTYVLELEEGLMHISHAHGKLPRKDVATDISRYLASPGGKFKPVPSRFVFFGIQLPKGELPEAGGESTYIHDYSPVAFSLIDRVLGSEAALVSQRSNFASRL